MHRYVRPAFVVGVAIVIGLVGLFASGVAVARDDKPSREDFRAEMRRLWEDHIVWTRQYIVSAATPGGPLDDLVPTRDRLLANQVDIGNAIAAFYGQEAGTALTGLLTDHIVIAARAIDEAKAGDDAGLEQALADWYANADDIASFLAAANPQYWPFEMMSDHMRSHLDLTLEEAVKRLGGDFAGDIAAYDAVHGQILEMADMLADGIAGQFPNRFSR